MAQTCLAFRHSSRLPFPFLVALALTLLGSLSSAHADPLDDCITLVAVDTEGAQRPFTLESTDVKAEASAGYVSVVVTQTFRNPFDLPLEGIYRFPLPHQAAVDRVALIVGGRLIEAEIQAREKARAVYEQAKEEGRRAALVESKRPNVFEQSVANVMPGELVHVTLRYVAPLRYEDSEYIFAFPGVVGPRYSSPSATTPAGEAGRINPAYVKDDDTRHRISVELHIKDETPVFQVHSPSHALETEAGEGDTVWVSVADTEALPNRTVEMRYRLAAAAPTASVVAHKDAGDTGTFVLTVEPPVSVEATEIQPKELFFVVDTSGSMMGEPLDKARAAMRYALKQMGPQDTFQVIDFASGVSSLAERPLSNTPANVRLGLAFIDKMSGDGGTEMLAGMRAALEGPTSAGRIRIVCFMTDGYIGNDGDVLSYVDDHVGQARLFSFGVGEDVNRYLLDEMATRGRGAVQYVRLGAAADPVEDVVETFYARMGQPLLTDVRIDWGGLEVSEVSPQRIPDLFMGLPMRVFGRYDKSGRAEVTVEGVQGGRRVAIPITVDLPRHAPAHSAIELIWAKQKVAGLLRPNEWEDSKEVIDEVTQIGLKHHILTRYTSFIAVERDLVANPTPELLQQALAAVHLPAGMRPEGLFGKRRKATLTPNAIKPGDPEILVHAPRDARDVHAILPWGEVVNCAWEPIHSAWLGRFLVPREAQEGRYRVRIYITHRSGEVEIVSLTYVVDSTAPAMNLTLDQPIVRAGGGVEVHATPIESVTRGHRSSLVRIRADVRRAIVVLNGRRITLAPDSLGHGWSGRVPIPSDLPIGRHVLELLVTDMAMNVHRAYATVTVR
jgi:Ca-activated chloride channel homolog